MEQAAEYIDKFYYEECEEFQINTSAILEDKGGNLFKIIFLTYTALHENNLV